jgi:hypothetical protein
MDRSLFLGRPGCVSTYNALDTCAENREMPLLTTSECELRGLVPGCQARPAGSTSVTAQEPSPVTGTAESV